MDYGGLERRRNGILPRGSGLTRRSPNRSVVLDEIGQRFVGGGVYRSYGIESEESSHFKSRKIRIKSKVFTLFHTLIHHRYSFSELSRGKNYTIWFDSNGFDWLLESFARMSSSRHWAFTRFEDQRTLRIDLQTNFLGDYINVSEIRCDGITKLYIPFDRSGHNAFSLLQMMLDFSPSATEEAVLRVSSEQISDFSVLNQEVEDDFSVPKEMFNLDLAQQGFIPFRTVAVESNPRAEARDFYVGSILINVNDQEADVGSVGESSYDGERVSTSNAIVPALEPLAVIFPEVEDSEEQEGPDTAFEDNFAHVRDYYSDSEMFVNEDPPMQTLAFFRDYREFDPDPEPWKEWYSDDGIDPDDHLQRWGGARGLTNALIRNNDSSNIFAEWGCATSSTPPAPRRSLRLAKKRKEQLEIQEKSFWDSDGDYSF